MLPLGIHPGFLLILLIIVLIVFGPGKLPELGSAIGRGIREFRKESDKIVDEVRSSATEKESSPAAPAEVRPTETRPTETRPTVTSEKPAASTESARAETDR